MRRPTITSVLIAVATLTSSVPSALAYWQFVAKGPSGERQPSPHFSTENECKAALKATEARLGKKYPERYPLVGSCEEFH